MEPDEVFDAYRARVNKLHTLLSSAKQRVESSFYTFILLDRLRPRYTQVVLALKAGAALKDPSAIDWDAVTTLVNAHERHEQNMNGTGEDERTMAAFSRQQKSKQTFSSSSSSSSPYDKQNFACVDARQGLFRLRSQAPRHPCLPRHAEEGEVAGEEEGAGGQGDGCFSSAAAQQAPG